MSMRRFCTCIALVGLVVFFGLSAKAEIVDGIVATVGTEIILHSELVQEIAPLLSTMQQASGSEEDFNRQAQTQLRAALEQAIDNKILLREALLAGLEIKDDMIEQRIAEIRKRFSSNEEFQKELEKAGITVSDFRERVRKQMLALSMGIRKRRELEKAANISETDIAQYYKDNLEKFSHNERIQLRKIFLAANQDSQERIKAKARLDEIKKQIDAGADFAELAKTYSMGPEAAQGGLMDWVTQKDQEKALSDAAFALKEGQVSAVIETQYGVALLKLEKKETAGTASLDEARKTIEPQLRAKAADEKYKKWLTELRKRSRVRVFLAS